MIYIAHRGNIDGKNENLENHPDYITKAIKLGYDVEVDIRYIDGGWWLGHDGPQWSASINMLDEISRGNDGAHHAWIHAKNIAALYQLRRIEWPGHYFYHQGDDAVLTSTGFLWTNPGQPLTPLSICVMPEWNGLIEKCQDLVVHGFCTDHAERIRIELGRS